MSVESELGEITKRYNNKRDDVSDALTDALCVAYKRVTGHAPSDSLRDKLWTLLHYETL